MESANSLFQQHGVAQRKEPKMNLMTKELATINFFIIWVIIFGGLLFLRIVKNRLEI
jgi:hypothetical protein